MGGLHSTDYETVVQTLTSRVIQDEDIPETIRTSLVTSMMSENPNAMVDNLTNAMLHGLPSTIATAHRFGSNYTYGMPTISSLVDSGGREATKSIIEDIVGSPVVIKYYKYTSLNPIHYVWKRLTETYGYNAVTNEIEGLFNSYNAKVYLDDIRVVLRTEAVLDSIRPHVLKVWGTPPNQGYTPARPTQNNLNKNESYTPYIIDGSITEDLVVRVYHAVVYPTHVGIQHVDWSFPLDDDSYYQAKYTYDDAGTKTGYFTYKQSLGTYPGLDARVFDASTVIANTLPFLHLRHNKGNLASSNLTETDDYKDSVILAKHYGIDFVEMANKINENPDIGDVHHAFMMLGVPMNTTNEIAIEYLYNFFADVLAKSLILYPNLSGELQEDAINKVVATANKSFLVRDRDVSMNLGYSGISRRHVTGTVSAKGKYTSVTSTSTPIDMIGELYDPETLESSLHLKLINNELVSYRKQISDTIYDEITIYNPIVTYHPYHDYTFTARYSSDSLLIPINYEITKNLPFSKAEKLYAMSYHLVFNASDVVKSHFYETEEFAKFIKGVAIILALFTFGKSLYVSGLVSGLTVQGAKTLIINLVMQALEAMAFKYVMGKIAAELGVENTIAVAIAAYAYAGYRGISNGGSLEGMPWADDLLKVANGLIESTKGLVGDLMKDIQKESEAFQTTMDEANKALEKAQDLLGNKGLIDPLDLLRVSPLTVWGETPHDYYQRTVHSGNVGILGLDAVHTYVRTSLTLPTVSDTFTEGD